MGDLLIIHNNEYFSCLSYCFWKGVWIQVLNSTYNVANVLNCVGGGSYSIWWPAHRWKLNAIAHYCMLLRWNLCFRMNCKEFSHIKGICHWKYVEISQIPPEVHQVLKIMLYWKYAWKLELIKQFWGLEGL